MFDKYTEFRETQQLRKDHKQVQKMQYALVMFAILGAIAIALVAVDTLASSKPVKSAAPPVSTALTPEMQEMKEIQDFATVVTKPLGQLTNKDLALVDAKAGMPCYENNTQLPYELMVKTIKECLHP